MKTNYFPMGNTTFTAAILVATSNAESIREAVLDSYRPDFLIGSAFNEVRLDDWGPNDKTYHEVFAREFNIGTAENHCKPMYVQPEQGAYDFTSCLRHFKKTIDAGMDFRGHTLVYHKGNGDWLQNGEFTAEELDKILFNTIFSVMRGIREVADNAVIQSWDVVNEAIFYDRKEKGFTYNDLGPWYPALPDYVHKAFTYAREADPDALLFYNDFHLERSADKRKKVIEMIEGMQEAGVPIDGIGIQYHVSVSHTQVTRESTANIIKTFGDMGLQVQITEIDVKLCVNEKECDPDDEQMLAIQARMYQDAFVACFYDNPHVCTAFVSWGFTDLYTRKIDGIGFAYPHYFDNDYVAKPAYDAVLYALQNPEEFGHSVVPSVLPSDAPSSYSTNVPSLHTSNSPSSHPSLVQSLLPPSILPSLAPSVTRLECTENSTDEFIWYYSKKNNNEEVLRTCQWLSDNKEQRKYICLTNVAYGTIKGPAQAVCQATCQSCGKCYENTNSYFFRKKKKNGKVILKKCRLLGKPGSKKAKKLCKNLKKSSGSYGPPAEVCPTTCGTASC